MSAMPESEPLMSVARRPSWHCWGLLLWPHRITAHLGRLVEARVIPGAPNLWQIELGVLRMWHRVLFRPETIGTCRDQRVRTGWRPWLLRLRPLRFPFLLWERAIAPLDHSGLAQPGWRMIRHLLAAHHDADQFAYDLEILRAQPGALEKLHGRVAEVVAGETTRGRWLADLCVFEGYHEALMVAVERALAGEALAEAHVLADPDIGFSAYIRWCRAQPETPAATWRAWRAGDFPRDDPR